MKEGDSTDLDNESVLNWHRAHQHVKKVKVMLSSNAGGVPKDYRVYAIEVILALRRTSTAVIVALPTSSTTKIATIGRFEEDGSCPDDHTEHSLSAREIELIFKSEEDFGLHYPEGFVASNPDGSPSSAWIRTFKRTRLSLLEAFSRYRPHGGEECDLGPPVLNDTRAKLLAQKEASFTHSEFSKFAEERGAVIRQCLELRPSVLPGRKRFMVSLTNFLGSSILQKNLWEREFRVFSHIHRLNR